ncbi:undecaprenyl-diphosphatase UppP [Candidatus Gracilibacteria bacterium]|nr:undecaprenyl-diphosphatase UppP [Candidatus Gracilibacteria bacterium]
MTIFDAAILGALQGVTEFLPISSSGHLVLGEEFLGLDVEGLKAFDVVVHLGSLMAILVYFWRDIKGLFGGLWGFLNRRSGEYEKLIGFILLGTIPAVVIGFTMEEMIDSVFRSVNGVAVGMLMAAAFFLIADRFYKGTGKLSVKKAFLIGVAQAVALIPGVSRSGSTISAGIMAGLSREEAARFSFLLGTPAIFGAGLLTALRLEDGEVAVSGMALAVGFIASFGFGLLSVSVLMKFLKKYSLKVFAVYLLILAGGVLILT